MDTRSCNYIMETAGYIFQTLGITAAGTFLTPDIEKLKLLSFGLGTSTIQRVLLCYPHLVPGSSQTTHSLGTRILAAVATFYIGSASSWAITNAAFYSQHAFSYVDSLEVSSLGTFVAMIVGAFPFICHFWNVPVMGESARDQPVIGEPARDQEEAGYDRVYHALGDQVQEVV